MSLFSRRKNEKINEKRLAIETGNAIGYQKTQEYQKGKRDIQKIKTIFDDGEGISGKTKTKATAKETERANAKDLSAVSALTETKQDGNAIITSTKVKSNYSMSVTLSGTPEEIEKEKKKLEKQMKNRKKEVQKEQKRLLQQGQAKHKNK